MNTVLAGICGVVVCLGVAAVVRGLVGTTRPPAPRRVGRRLDLGRAETRRLVAGLVAGLVVWALSGWAVAVVLAPLLVVGVPHLLGEPPQREVELRVRLAPGLDADAVSAVVGLLTEALSRSEILADRITSLKMTLEA